MRRGRPSWIASSGCSGPWPARSATTTPPRPTSSRRCGSRLAEHCGRIRQPDRLASWLATTCRNECLSLARRRNRELADARISDLVESQERGQLAGLEERSLDEETYREVLQAFALLPEGCQQLLRLLCTDPPLDYQSISDLIGRPIGSIGPTRQRCLDRLRNLTVTADA